ncbi:MAG: putative hydrolase [Bradyrhizobium sp.]|nr:putative hydrolase [Bradyrhizobium sp.]
MPRQRRVEGELAGIDQLQHRVGRAASSPGGIWAVLKALRDTDVRHLLPRVAVPTLVLHRTADQAVRLAAGRDMASHITGAEFVELDGNDH